MKYFSLTASCVRQHLNTSRRRPLKVCFLRFIVSEMIQVEQRKQEAQQVKAECVLVGLLFCKISSSGSCLTEGPNGAKNSPTSYFIIFDFNRHPEGSAAVRMLMLYGAVKKRKKSPERRFFPHFSDPLFFYRLALAG